MSTLSQGLTYSGVISITPVTALELNGDYNDDMRKNHRQRLWGDDANVPRTRQISTYFFPLWNSDYLFN